jgi:5-methylcytosine-specific restriction endonuclease McrA
MNYERHYNILIEKARSRKLTVYSEKHHVIPRCLGGGNEAANIVRLTAEEHYIAHQLLVKIHPNNHKLVFAAWMMCNGSQRSNKRYAWLKRKQIQALSETHRGKKMPEWNKAKLIEANTGRVCSEETRQKISQAQIGKVLSDEHRRKLSDAHRGKKQSAETIKRRADSLRGRKRTHEQKKRLSEIKQGVKIGPLSSTQCPHCGKIGAGGVMQRWHFERCKVVNGAIE